MEPSQVRRCVRESIERARHAAAARRAASEAAARAWQPVRDTVVIPVWHQAVQVLRSEGFLFQVSTPADTVRVSSEKAAQDGVELSLDTSVPSPQLLLRVTRTRGREVLSEERVVVEGTDAIAAMHADQALAILLDALTPFFER